MLRHPFLFFSSEFKMKMVLYLDNSTKRIIRIPASDIPPGAIATTMDGHDEAVWIAPEEQGGSLFSDPDFQESYDDAIAKIQSAFSEHRSLTKDQWKQSLGRDPNPDFAVASWSRAADVYLETAAAPSITAKQRREIYDLLLRMVEASPAIESRAFKLNSLSEEMANAVVARFQGN